MSENLSNLTGFSESDQRYFPRWTVRNKISYSKEDDVTSRDGYTKDISCSGVCIAVNEPLEQYEIIKLVIHLSDAERVAVTGRIRWFKNFGMQRMAGVDFSNIGQETQDLILQHAFEVDRKNVIDGWFKGWDTKDKK